MAESDCLVSFELRRYDEPLWGFIHYGPWRWGLGFSRFIIVLEMWGLR